ncbi:hypothetical protein [Massilia endophytica]|uniref:hypothetical protein n=1 Tax=Massilia endophytica TaxID=2899220 RepID=UPI001E44A2AD|nr:hypothetical protein [Massilia endophytica]UGQ44982.1 hypothetical protein LSQ66_14365 [Massilia endophytica]
MNEPEIVRTAVEAASNPKVATGVAAAVTSAGAAAKLDLIQGWLSTATMSIGLVTAGVVLAIQLIKLARTWRAYRKDERENEE